MLTTCLDLRWTHAGCSAQPPPGGRRCSWRCWRSGRLCSTLAGAVILVKIQQGICDWEQEHTISASSSSTVADVAIATHHPAACPGYRPCWLVEGSTLPRRVRFTSRNLASGSAAVRVKTRSVACPRFAEAESTQNALHFCTATQPTPTERGGGKRKRSGCETEVWSAIFLVCQVFQWVRAWARWKWGRWKLEDAGSVGYTKHDVQTQILHASTAWMLRSIGWMLSCSPVAMCNTGPARRAIRPTPSSTDAGNTRQKCR